MKKKLSYRDKLLELAYIYNVREIQDYTKRRKNLTSGQIELILKKNKIIILDLDLCIIDDEIDEMIRDSVISVIDVPKENIRISVSHTHAGPPYGRSDSTGGGWLTEGVDLIKPYYDGFPKKISYAVKEATSSLKRCNI